MKRAYLLTSLLLSSCLITDSHCTMPGWSFVRKKESKKESPTVAASPLVAEAMDDADESPSRDGSCIKGPHPMRVTLRHIEANGVGYNRGYSTLEGFFTSQHSLNNSWIPFLDLRGHIFNNGKLAANAGIGLRHLDSRVWGINAYYDYRKTTLLHYNQVSLGFESLGRVWDFRINGYLPVGKKKGSLMHTHFREFEGHHMILSSKREVAMKGGNAEFGVHANPCRRLPVYFAAGPYYLQGGGKVAWGGEARIALDIFDYIRLEGNTSYDNVFKWIGQGQASLIIPFGGRKKITRKNGRSCAQELCLRERALQRVDRNEIIPVDKVNKKTVAIDPSTGEPYVFWFVNNTSHSAGTFESPFNTLVAAQNASGTNDVIYVYPGDGTTTGMDVGITLQNNQKFFGAGINQQLTTTLGNIEIPAMASSNPSITNPLNTVVTCANNNEISGFTVNANGATAQGIVAANITNLTIHDNTVIMTNGSNLPQGEANGIGLQACLGQVSIYNNLLSYPDLVGTIFGVHLLSVTPQGNYLITNNRFVGVVGAKATGIELGDHKTTPLTNFNNITISNNFFTGLGASGTGKAIGGDGFAGTGQVILDRNTFTNNISGAGNFAIAGFNVRFGANLAINITNNVFQLQQDQALYSTDVTIQNSSASVCVLLTGNQSDVPGSAYSLNNGNMGQITADIGNNVGAILEQGTITAGTCP